MLIVDSIQYSAQGLPNNRCSRLRSMPFTHDYSCEVVEWTDAEAPLLVEIGHAEQERDENGKKRRKSTTWRQYRIHAGQVWVPTETTIAEIPAFISRILTQAIDSWRDRESQAIAKFNSALEKFVANHRIIDGQLWEPGQEPAIILQFHHYMRETFLWLKVVDQDYEMGKAGDGLVFRLDEFDVAVREVAQRHKFRGEVRTVDTADVLIRNLRSDLITRPSFNDYLARVAWHELAHIVARDRDDIAKIRSAADALALRLVSSRPPHGCDPQKIITLIRLLAEITPILEDPAIDARAERDPENDEQHLAELARAEAELARAEERAVA